MKLLKKLARVWRHFKVTEKFEVWTQDDCGRRFHYDIRIAPVRDRSRFLVKFMRTNASLNTLVVRRILTPEAVQDLRLRATS